jgi:hypothetical protein
MGSQHNDVKGRKPKETYMLLGFGNYGGSPNPQLNGGLVRNPSMLEPLFRLLGILEDRLRDDGLDAKNPK